MIRFLVSALSRMWLKKYLCAVSSLCASSTSLFAYVFQVSSTALYHLHQGRARGPTQSPRAFKSAYKLSPTSTPFSGLKQTASSQSWFHLDLSSCVIPPAFPDVQVVVIIFLVPLLEVLPPTTTRHHWSPISPTPLYWPLPMMTFSDTPAISGTPP
ncbi:hypothetical protein C8R43DRAFT_394434 [Mycena crocata]|nr:hypothetical protein C8R43DRAFT_394434 [Mycena crocata]